MTNYEFVFNKEHDKVQQISIDFCKYYTRQYLLQVNIIEKDNESNLIFGCLKANSFAHAEQLINDYFCVNKKGE